MHARCSVGGGERESWYDAGRMATPASERIGRRDHELGATEKGWAGAAARRAAGHVLTQLIYEMEGPPPPSLPPFRGWRWWPHSGFTTSCPELSWAVLSIAAPYLLFTALVRKADRLGEGRSRCGDALGPSHVGHRRMQQREKCLLACAQVYFRYRAKPGPNFPPANFPVRALDGDNVAG